jgi:hypothetical protein
MHPNLNPFWTLIPTKEYGRAVGTHSGYYGQTRIHRAYTATMIDGLQYGLRTVLRAALRPTLQIELCSAGLQSIH